MTLKLINAELVGRLLDHELARESQRAAFLAIADGHAWQPQKIGGSHPADTDTVFCYAARLGRGTGAVSKFGSVNPANHRRGLPTVHASVVLLDATTGAPVALLDGSSLTELRTAAASAVAIEALARPGPNDLLVLGAGVQGRQHVRAIAASRDLRRIVLWSRRPESARAAADELRADGYDVTVSADLGASLREADVVVCATLTTTPLFEAVDLAAGATVVSIGSFEATRSELGVDTLHRSEQVVVDDLATARNHCGPVVLADRQQPFPLALVTVGDVLAGRGVPRSSEDSVLTYLSVGLGVQDAAAAWAVYDRAVALGCGDDVDW